MNIYHLKNWSFFILGILFLAISAQIAAAQEKEKYVLTDREKSEVIDKVIELLEKNYVYPETANKMKISLLDNARKNEYQKVSDPVAFAERINADLRSVSRDLHLGLRFSPDVLPPDSGSMIPVSEVFDEMRRIQSRENYGVAKIEILQGNVGLIRFNYFASPEWAGDAYAAAMNSVVETDALILDLRTAAGSTHPDAVPFVCSYFFEKPVHLYDIYWRPENKTQEFWTNAQVAGKRYASKPIYILTSRQTFSGAEEMVYDLKNLKRVTVVGGATGGGAYSGGDRRVNDHFAIWLPIGRAINPITKTDWEGTGVKPDIETSPNKAFDTAYLQAINKSLQSSPDPQWKQVLQQTSKDITDKLQSFKKVEFKLKGFNDAKKVTLAGEFNGWSKDDLKLTKSSGEWRVQVELEPGTYQYKFIVDGKWITDPANPRKKGEGETQNSIISFE